MTRRVAKAGIRTRRRTGETTAYYDLECGHRYDVRKGQRPPREGDERDCPACRRT